MNPALEQLNKVLALETKNGYPNTAVIGGLPKMLNFWEPNARRANMDPAFIENVATLVRQYGEQSATERAATVQALQNLAQTAASPRAPTVTEVPFRLCAANLKAGASERRAASVSCVAK